ncbi:MAG: tryptophan 7-halogenase [Exilibacterium sp.]
MEHHKGSQYDLIVVGAGPGGSTLATFVAMQGHKVLVLDKDTFPRYQIGESLLPATINGICVMLGVDEEIHNAGFQKKLGGSFRWGKNPEPWSFFFGVTHENRKNPAFAYQVDRKQFDWILIKNAIKNDVEVRMNCCVSDPIFENDRVCGVSYIDEDGENRVAYGKYVVDAAGNTSKLGRHVGERKYSAFFKNYAIFGYYEGGKRFEKPLDGNILSAAFDEGWFWYIPISREITSVGAVFHAPDNDEKRPFEGDIEQTMKNYIARCPAISDLLKNAKRITEGDYGKLRVRKDWSYTTSKFYDRGMLLVGDSACFVDPLLSQGVHLATYSALLAARSINSCLKETIDEERSFSEFEYRYRREYSLFYEYLTSLYDMHAKNEDAKESFFWAARSLLNTQERGNEAFIRLLAGQANFDPAINTAQDFFDSRVGSGSALENVMNPSDVVTQEDMGKTGVESISRRKSGCLLEEILFNAKKCSRCRSANSLV